MYIVGRQRIIHFVYESNFTIIAYGFNWKTADPSWRLPELWTREAPAGMDPLPLSMDDGSDY